MKRNESVSARPKTKKRQDHFSNIPLLLLQAIASNYNVPAVSPKAKVKVVFLVVVAAATTVRTTILSYFLRCYCIILWAISEQEKNNVKNNKQLDSMLYFITRYMNLNYLRKD